MVIKIDMTTDVKLPVGVYILKTSSKTKCLGTPAHTVGIKTMLT